MSVAAGVLLVVALVANGLLAGLFLVFACAVSPGFRSIDDTSFVQAFRAINRTIVNGLFLVIFLGAPVAALAVAVLEFWIGVGPSSWFAAAGAVCSVLTFAITVGRNVPLNDALDRADVGTPAACSAARGAFEEAWSRWNLVRTLTSAGALLTLAGAAVVA